MFYLFYLDTKIKKNCYGCRACEQVCPVGCIKTTKDSEGFIYPSKIEDLCINCNLCKNVCPNYNSKKIDNYVSNIYMAINKDEKTLEKSSSGGVFSALVNLYCKENFMIFGVEFDNDFNVVHTYTSQKDNIAKYRKSKYVQSDIGDCYKKAEEFLKEDKYVLFTGTPCQIAGLKLFLKKDYKNLLCVDIVCHGVPSQKIFHRYIDYLQKKHKGHMQSFMFRYKSKHGLCFNSRNIKAVINNKVIIKNSDKDYFLKGYHNALFYRPSCYYCKYSSPYRVSDITMADFWGVEGLYPNENVHKGVSIILTNTIKGKLLIEDLKKEMKIVEVNKEYVINNNGQLNHSAKLHPKRELFYELLKTKTFDEAIRKCKLKPSFLRRSISNLIPKKMKKVLKRLIK